MDWLIWTITIWLGLGLLVMVFFYCAGKLGEEYDEKVGRRFGSEPEIPRTHDEDPGRGEIAAPVAPNQEEH